MYSQSDLNLNECFCVNNNNGDKVSNKFNMDPVPGSSGIMQNKISETNIKKEEIQAIKHRFPNKVPVFIQKYAKDNQLPVLDKSKFLIPADIPMSHFQTILRKRLQMSQTQALYILINNRSMMSLTLTVEEVYKEHAQPNGFLHVTYASQEAFGNREKYAKSFASVLLK